MSEILTIDPEVEAILREIAADPHSSLLRVTRPQVVKGLFERYPRVSPGMAGLTAAERQLLQVHRNEVAWLLREICKYRLATDERTSLFLSRNLTIDKEVEVLDEATLRERARLGQRESLPMIGEPEIVELLARCTAGSLHEGPTTTQLAIASMRLEPHDSGRVLMGLDLSFGHSARTALEVYRHLLAGDPDSLIASIAWEDSAIAHNELGNRSLSLSAYRCAVKARGNRVNPILYLFHFGLLLGSTEDVLVASKELDDPELATQSFVSHFISLQNEHRNAGLWAPSPESRALVKSLRSQLSDTARRIADALA